MLLYDNCYYYLDSVIANCILRLFWMGESVTVKFSNYQRDILTNVVGTLNQTMVQNRPCIFEQDSAPAYKANTTQQWLGNYVPEFISSYQPAQTLIHTTTNCGQF